MTAQDIDELADHLKAILISKRMKAPVSHKKDGALKLAGDALLLIRGEYTSIQSKTESTYGGDGGPYVRGKGHVALIRTTHELLIRYLPPE